MTVLYIFSSVFYSIIFKVGDLPGIFCFFSIVSGGISQPSFPALSSELELISIVSF